MGLIFDENSDIRISIPLICHLGLLYHYRVSFVLGVPHHFYPLPSSFFLRVLPKCYRLGVHFRSLSFFLLIIVLVWPFFPSGFVRFYSAGNKQNASFPLKLPLCGVMSGDTTVLTTQSYHISYLPLPALLPSRCVCVSTETVGPYHQQSTVHIDHLPSLCI